MPSLKTTIERDDSEIEVTVRYDISPECKGSRDTFGAPLEPDTPLEITVYPEVYDRAGREFILTDAEADSIRVQIFESEES